MAAPRVGGVSPPFLVRARSRHRGPPGTVPRGWAPHAGCGRCGAGAIELVRQPPEVRLLRPHLDLEVAGHLDAAARAIEARAGGGRPCLVAIDGRSGTGKSTLARLLAPRLGAEVLDGDDFYAGGVELRRDAPRERALACIDWRRQRAVLEALRGGRRATWHAFDWETFDGRLAAASSACEPARVVLLEGAYSGRPELADLLDLRILLTAPPEVRRERLLSREGALGPWEVQWHEAEDWYFGERVSEASFDLVLGQR